MMIVCAHVSVEGGCTCECGGKVLGECGGRVHM